METKKVKKRGTNGRASQRTSSRSAATRIGKKKNERSRSSARRNEEM